MRVLVTLGIYLQFLICGRQRICGVTMTVSYLNDPITFKNYVQAESSEKCAHLFVMHGLSPFHFEAWLLPTRSHQLDVWSVENFAPVKIKLRIQETCVLP